MTEALKYSFSLTSKNIDETGRIVFFLLFSECWIIIINEGYENGLYLLESVDTSNKGKA